MQLDLVAGIRDALAGRYVVDREVGHGGMAMVCRARDLAADRDVAIKVLYPDLARAVGGERFLREIAILADLNHPNILPLLDSGTAEVMPGVRVPWYVMPFVEEETLRARLQREGPLPVDLALRYTRELSAALTHAHAQGYIHRDIKPENILLRGDQAVLADFGIARAVTVAGGSTLSSTGIVVGTPAYMSPEQSVGSEKLDGRSDLYSLGIVLYEMLAGHPPFTGATPQSVSARHQFEPPPPIAVVRPGLPSGIESAVDRVLAKVPADRFDGAAAFALALERAAKSRPTLPRRVRIQRWAMTAAAVCAVSAAAWFWGPAFLSGEQLDPSRYVVLPFRLRDSTATPLISGGSCEQLISDILGRIPDHKLVSSLTVGSELSARGGALTKRGAVSLARQYGAGKVIWGEIATLHDSLLITGALYDAASGRELESHTIRLPRTEIGIGELAQQFADLTYRLVLPHAATPETAADALGARSFDAWQLYSRGDSAINAWDLALARSFYTQALVLDPDYPNANLKLAQVAQWRDEPSSSWAVYANHALRFKARLNRSNQLMAQSLSDLAAGRFAEACTIYRSMLTADSLEFRGWYGLGECLTRDQAVIADSSSVSGWRFRSSYASGLKAFETGLALAPASFQAYSGGAFRQLARRFMTNPSSIRFGTSDQDSPMTFLAFPGLTNDTLSFVPYPTTRSFGDIAPSSWVASLAANRSRLVRVTGRWLSRFPNSIPAIITHAEALEVAGRIAAPDESPTALELVAAVRATPKPPNPFDLAVREVRLRVKTGDLAHATSIAESLLAVPPQTTEEGVTQAGLAALVGRADRAAALLATNGVAQFVTSAGEVVSLPPTAAADANRLLVYSGFGGPTDSLTAIVSRLTATVNESVASAVRREAIDAALFRPRLLAYPSIPGEPLGRQYAFAQAVECLSREDRDCVIKALDTRKLMQPDGVRSAIPADFGLLEARIRLLAGDTSGARDQLSFMLTSLHGLSVSFLDEPTESAAIQRSVKLCQLLHCTVASPASPVSPRDSLSVSAR